MLLLCSRLRRPLCYPQCTLTSRSQALNTHSWRRCVLQALADYMESKRRAFPRFYFVSTADLLDILSNGNSPTRVMMHMSKCFQVGAAGPGTGRAVLGCAVVVIRGAMRGAVDSTGLLCLSSLPCLE